MWVYSQVLLLEMYSNFTPWDVSNSPKKNLLWNCFFLSIWYTGVVYRGAQYRRKFFAQKFRRYWAPLLYWGPIPIMIPTAPFTPVGVSNQWNSGILELSRQSSILIGHWLIVTLTVVKGAVGIIFDITGIFLPKNFEDIGKFGDIGPEILPPLYIM
jgi:hypothetical protein